MTLAPSRRAVLGGALAAPLATPLVWRRANAAPRLVVRTTGGVYDDIMRRSYYDAFTKETGIEVATAPAPMTKLIAMYKAGGAEFDVIDTGDGGLLTLERMGALQPIDYGAWRFAKPADIPADLRFPFRVANYVYATVNVYNTDSFGGRHPQGWAEWWDLKAFPGPRTLPDMASGQAPLEFALLADGVSPDKLYPMDLPRAFKALDRIRAAIPKFWDTGALSAQLLTTKEAVLGALWSGRAQTAIDAHAPLALDWTQNMIQVQAYGIPKNTKDPKAAQLFVDFASQPSAQVGYARDLRYGPSNTQAFSALSADLLSILPGGPRYKQLGFFQDITWWEDNRDRVNKAWSAWVLG